MSSFIKKFPMVKPQPIYEWTPTSYDMDKALSSYRGEKWLSDQTNFMMEIMKFMPNIDKESFRKGPGKLISNGKTGGDWLINGQHPANMSTLPSSNPYPASNRAQNEAYKDYLERMYGYDRQYLGLGLSLKWRTPSAGSIYENYISVDTRAFKGSRHTYEYNYTYPNATDGWSFARGHSLAYDGSLDRVEGYGAGGAVAEHEERGRKKAIYDFFMNFWDFSGSYQDYFSDYKPGQNRKEITGSDRLSGSFFITPWDIYSNDDKNTYRTEFNDRGLAPIPIYSQPTTWGDLDGDGIAERNTFNGGKNISSMSWNEFRNLYPTDYTTSYYARNPSLLEGNELPSLTGYDRINKMTGKTHFQEAVDYFSSTAAGRAYTSRYGKALTIAENQKDYTEIDRAGFYDLMMDPDAPWNTGTDTGSGWWAERSPSGRNGVAGAAGTLTDWQFENMKAAFYIMILAVEATRRALHATTQWFGPSTAFQGFDFAPTRGTGRYYVENSDKYMIEYFKWYGEDYLQRGVGRRPDDNPYWRSAESPLFRSEFNNLFKTSIHEFYGKRRNFGGITSWAYSMVDNIAVRNLDDWMKIQMDRLMDPKNVITRHESNPAQDIKSVLAHIHPAIAPQTVAKEKFEEFVEPPDATYDIDNSINTVWNAGSNLSSGGKTILADDKYAEKAVLTKNGSSTFSWSWTRERADMLSSHASAINTHYSNNIASQRPSWATDDELKDFYKGYLQKYFSGVSVTSERSVNSVELSGLGDADINVNGGNRSSGDPVKVAEYTVSAYHYLKPDRSSAEFSKTVTYHDGERHYQWKPGQTGDKPWVYQSCYYYPNKKNGSGETTSWVDQGSRSTLPSKDTGLKYDAIRSKTITWDGTKTYNDSAQTRTIDEKYKIEANMNWQDQSKQFTRGHNIVVTPTYDIGSGVGTLSVTSHGIKTQITYKDATEFRQKYQEFQQNAAKPYEDMSLSTYRMERDNPSGQSIVLPEDIDTLRCAHQWYRKRADVRKALGLEGDPELKRLYSGGALAELYREHSFKESPALAMPEGMDHPVKTSKWSWYAWANWNTNSTEVGHWSLYSGNLRRDISTSSRATQIDGFNIFTAKDPNSTIFYKDASGTTRSMKGSVYDNMWGFYSDYNMFNTSTYSTNYIMFQQVLLKQKIQKFKDENKQYAEYKQEESQDKAREESIEARKKSEQNQRLQKAAKQSNEAKQRARTEQARATRRRQESTRTSQKISEMIRTMNKEAAKNSGKK